MIDLKFRLKYAENQAEIRLTYSQRRFNIVMRKGRETKNFTLIHISQEG